MGGAIQGGVRVYLRHKRLVKDWLNSENVDDEWDEVVRPANCALDCENCSVHSEEIMVFEFSVRDIVFLCPRCIEKIGGEELPPPGWYSSSKGLSLRFRVLERDKFTCIYCGRNPRDNGVKLEVDHIVPKSKGGPDEMSNLVTACWECNQGKKDLLTDSIIEYNSGK